MFVRFSPSVRTAACLFRSINTTNLRKELDEHMKALLAAKIANQSHPPKRSLFKSPKRPSSGPRNSWSLFFAQFLAHLRATNQSTPISKAAKAASLEWAAIGQAEKDALRVKMMEIKSERAVILKAWKKEYGKQAKDPKISAIKGRPNPAFLRFLVDCTKLNRYPNLADSPKGHVAKVAEKWRSLPELEKQVYIDEARKEFEAWKETRASKK